MRPVRTLPHTTTLPPEPNVYPESSLYIGIPDAVWYDATDGVFLGSREQASDGNNLLLNLIPSDEVHISASGRLSATSGSAFRVVAGAFDAANFIELSVEVQSDALSDERWLMAFEPSTYPAGDFPPVAMQPPVPFPFLDPGSEFLATQWTRLQLNRVVAGERVLLNESVVPLQPDRDYRNEGFREEVFALRLTVVRQLSGTARIIGAFTAYRNDHFAQVFFLESELENAACGNLCGY